MDSKILQEAKKDIPLYLNDFNDYWKEVVANFKEQDLIDCYVATLIFKNWKASLNHINDTSVDVFLGELHEDVNASFYFAHLGYYRSAHMHLRSLIELVMQLVYFSQHEVEYVQWQTGDFVIKQDVLSDYLKRHPHFSSKDSANLIADLTKHWKGLSKHIHAETPTFFQSNKSKSYSEKDFNIWKSDFRKVTYLANKLLLLHYKEQIIRFPSVERKILLRDMKRE